LISVFDRYNRSLHGDNRLARSDVALQQPVHRFRASHIGNDFLENALLRIGRFKRQHGAHCVSNSIAHFDDRAFGSLLASLSAEPYCKRKPKELLENQSSMSGRSDSVVVLE